MNIVDKIEHPTHEVSYLFTCPLRKLPTNNKEIAMILHFAEALKKFFETAKDCIEIETPKVETVAARPHDVISYSSNNERWHRVADSSGEIGFIIVAMGRKS